MRKFGSGGAVKKFAVDAGSSSRDLENWFEVQRNQAMRGFVATLKIDGHRYVDVTQASVGTPEGYSRKQADALAERYRSLGYRARVVTPKEWSRFSGTLVYVWKGRR